MADPLKIDPELLTWANPRDKEIIEAIERTGSAIKAEKALGLTHGFVSRQMKRLRIRAAKHGYAPAHNLTHIIPEPFIAKGHSTYYDRNGKPTQQWVKSKLDDQQHQAMVREAISEFIHGEVTRPFSTPRGPKDPETDIIPWFNIGDAHLGMLAHEAETGENFDLAIAERELIAAFELAIEEVGEHERCVLNDLGDFTHYENFTGTTEASGHALDYDSRFPKMIHTYSRLMRALIEILLRKFTFVDVIINQGNHSRTNDIWMAELLRVAYANSNRVIVLNNDSVFIPYRMGATFVMVHHSDLCKPNKLAGVMSTDFRKDWGESEYHYIDIGHIHHNMVLKEHPGVTIESFNQLAPHDRWAHDGGYRSRSSLSVILRSRTYGEIGRKVLPIRKIRDRILKAMEAAGTADKIYVPKPKTVYTV